MTAPGGEALLKLSVGRAFDLYRTRRPAPDQLELTLVKSSYRKKRPGKPLLLRRTDRTSHCNTANDCAVHALSNRDARWVCDPESQLCFDTTRDPPPGSTPAQAPMSCNP
jgi:hypothetical protein